MSQSPIVSGREPYPDASLIISIRRFFAKYWQFRGRASRSEFWWWTFLNVIVSTVLSSLSATALSDVSGVLSGSAGFSYIPLAVLVTWAAATFIPGLTLLVRRLHDVNRGGGWVLLALVPAVGLITLFVFALMPSKPEGVRFDA